MEKPPVDRMSNNHAKRLRSHRKDSARIPMEQLQPPVPRKDNRVDEKRKSLGAVEFKSTTIDSRSKEQLHISMDSITENKVISRNTSSPMLSKNQIEVSGNRSPPPESTCEKVEVDYLFSAPSKSKKGRGLTHSISSRIAHYSPILSNSQNTTTTTTNQETSIPIKKKKKKSSLSIFGNSASRSRSISVVDNFGINRGDINSPKMENRGNRSPTFLRNNNMNNLSPKVVHHSPTNRRKSPQETSPSNVHIYARHSGLSGVNNGGSYKRDIAEEQSKRFRIIQELRDTERSYVTSLHMVSVIFISPLKSKMNTPKQILSAKELKSIFGNIEDVCHFSQKFLESIEVRIHPSVWTNDSTIGDLFNQIMDESKISEVYHEYVDTYESALSIIRDAFHNENSLFGKFAKEKQILCDNHSLSSLLVLPIQRIPRYQLLLEDLIKSTPMDHKDKNSLIVAHKKMVSLANSLNESKWREESQQKMREISQKFKKGFHGDLNVKGRELIAQGEIVQIPAGSDTPEVRTLFLFNDLVVCASNCKQSKLKVDWKSKSVHCRLQFDENDETDKKKIVIREMKLITKQPYLIEHIEVLYPSDPPYDFSFWKSSLQSAFDTFQWDQDRLLLDTSALVTSHMKKYLIGERELTMLQIGAKKTSFLNGEVICASTVCCEILFL